MQGRRRPERRGWGPRRRILEHHWIGWKRELPPFSARLPNWAGPKCRRLIAFKPQITAQPAGRPAPSGVPHIRSPGPAAYCVRCSDRRPHPRGGSPYIRMLFDRRAVGQCVIGLGLQAGNVRRGLGDVHCVASEVGTPRRLWPVPSSRQRLKRSHIHPSKGRFAAAPPAVGSNAASSSRGTGSMAAAYPTGVGHPQRAPALVRVSRVLVCYLKMNRIGHFEKPARQLIFLIRRRRGIM